MMLVIFEEIHPARSGKSAVVPKGKRQRQVDEIKKLEEKLNFTRENLQPTIEELETSNEELKSTNEELQSTSEELQSTNEELETSKGELQSLHEESSTVNAELQSPIDDLVAANDDKAMAIKIRSSKSQHLRRACLRCPFSALTFTSAH